MCFVYYKYKQQFAPPEDNYVSLGGAIVSFGLLCFGLLFYEDSIAEFL